MAAKFELHDDSVVVVVGTGAGGGVLSNELAQKGVKVVALEAGGRLLPEDYVNDEWASFGPLAWVDPRTTSGDWRVAKDFAGLPAWIVKAVGGTTIHWAGASLRFQDHEWTALSTYGPVAGANLLDWPIDPREIDVYYGKAEDKLWSPAPAAAPACPAATIIWSLKRAPRRWAIARCIPGVWRSTARPMTTAPCACRPGSAFRAVNGANGRPPIPTSRAARRPVSGSA